MRTAARALRLARPLVARASLPLALAVATACATAPPPPRGDCPPRLGPDDPRPTTTTTRASARRPSIFRLDTTTPEQRRLIALHCPRGRPRWWSSPPPGTLDLIARESYVLEHSAADRIALFVCARVDRANLGGDVDRKERFAADPQLDPARRAELSDYKGSGYSRGHQAPSADQTTSRERNDETFLLSNMTPQQQTLNGGQWAQLEKRVRAWAQRWGAVWVVTGPLFYDPAEEDPATADGVVEHATIGGGRVAVPTHYFKVVVAEVDGQLRAAAFVLPNRAPERGSTLADDLVAIDWIEARAGLDLLPDLETSEEARLERAPGALWE